MKCPLVEREYVRKFAVYKMAPAAAKVFSPFKILSQVYKLATNKQLRGYYAKNRVSCSKRGARPKYRRQFLKR